MLVISGGSLAASLLGGSVSALLLAANAVRQNEPASGQSKTGEAYALAGYAELLLAEDFCAGVPLSEVLQNGGTQNGMPLTSDSLLGVAQAHFDSAIAYEGTNDTVMALAHVGLGRTFLDRGTD